MLNFSGVDLSREGDYKTIMMAMAGATNLVTISLDNCNLDADGISHLVAHLKVLPCVKRLSLSSASLPGACVCVCLRVCACVLGGGGGWKHGGGWVYVQLGR